MFWDFGLSLSFPSTVKYNVHKCLTFSLFLTQISTKINFTIFFRLQKNIHYSAAHNGKKITVAKEFPFHIWLQDVNKTTFLNATGYRLSMFKIHYHWLGIAIPIYLINTISSLNVWTVRTLKISIGPCEADTCCYWQSTSSRQWAVNEMHSHFHCNWNHQTNKWIIHSAFIY